MGNQNQLEYIRSHMFGFEGPYLEIGSRNYGNTQDLRSLVRPGQKYVGLDMSGGEGVDLVLNLTEDFDKIDRCLNGERFATIFCLSVMEHCDDPFKMADNVTRLMKPSGKLCISVPFAWKFHAYPSDYWRFTHMGVMKLFPGLHFDLAEAEVSTGRDGDVSPLSEEMGRITFSRRSGWKRFIASKIGLSRWLLGQRYVMPPTMITMIGELT